MGNLNAMVLTGVAGLFYLVHIYINHPYEWLTVGLFALILGLSIEDKQTEAFLKMFRWVFIRDKIKRSVKK